MLKAVIFDMDGVLINSTKYIWKSFNILLKDSGVHFSDKDIKKYLGFSLRDKLELWKKDYGIGDYNLEEFSRKAGKMELEFMKKELHPNEDLDRFLNELKDNGIKLAVATSSLRWRAEKILEVLQIKEFFDAIVTAEDVKNHKPSPDIFLEAAKQLDENPENCVVFEDAVNGIEAAKKGNMKAIAMKTEFHSRKELKNADLIIDDFSEINLKKLEKLF
ncbi:MAG: HAD family phosphatase [Candidatus Paceibacterota bacterium]